MNLIIHEIYVLIMAMLPISELRGAIPLGIALDIPWQRAAMLGIIGNLMVVPVVLGCVEWLFHHMRKLEVLRKHIERYESRAANKIAHYREYRLLGLFLLVAIPLPGTGAYTGCVAARVMKIRFRNAWAVISAGVITAGIIVTLATKGVIHLNI